MKRILLIAVLLGTMITATTYFVCIAAPSVLFGKGIKGSGNIVTRTIDAPDFDRVDAARAVKVVITGKATGKIIDRSRRQHYGIRSGGGQGRTPDGDHRQVGQQRIERRRDRHRPSQRAASAHSTHRAPRRITSDVTLNGRQILDRRIECRQRSTRPVKSPNPAQWPHRAHRKSTLRSKPVSCSGGGFERIENHAEGLGRRSAPPTSARPRSFRPPRLRRPPSARVNTSSAAKAVGKLHGAYCTPTHRAAVRSATAGDCQTSINKSSGGSVGRN